MAKPKPKHTLTSSQSESGTTHRGTREQLIVAGLAKPEHFPGQPGCGSWSTRFWPENGRKFRVSCYTAPALRSENTLFEVEIYSNREEKAACRAAQCARWEAEREREEQQEQETIDVPEARRHLRLVVDNDRRCEPA
jgi:hypothetical protein